MMMCRSKSWVLLGVSLLLLGAGPQEKSARPLPQGAIQVTPDSISWGPASASLPPGAKMAVLEGDPKKDGIFTMRVMLPRGTRILPHTHPRDERVTVISGEVGVGFGDNFDSALLKRFPTGSFYVNPAGSRHFISTDEETVLQITGIGPWELKAAPPSPPHER
jgi:quercetin dioxygenase-like cupin family protein